MPLVVSCAKKSSMLGASKPHLWGLNQPHLPLSHLHVALATINGIAEATWPQ